MLYKKKLKNFSFLLIGALFFLGTGLVQGGLDLGFSGLPEGLKKRYTSIQFNHGGNNIQGGIFWSATHSLDTPQPVNINGTNLLCKEQIRGMYYNSTRGSDVLWPMDPWTLENFTGSSSQGADKYEDLELENGLFTSCYETAYTGNMSKDNFIGGGIYGELVFTGKYNGSLIAGISYDVNDNNLDKPISKQESLAFLANVPAPIGYVYDNGGAGIGFVGGILTGDTPNDIHKDMQGYIQSSGIRDIFDLGENNNIVWESGAYSGTITENSGLLEGITQAANEILTVVGLKGFALASNDSMKDEIYNELVQNLGHTENGGTQTSTITRSNENNLSGIINNSSKSAKRLCDDGYDDSIPQSYGELDSSLYCLSSSDGVVEIGQGYLGSAGISGRKTIIIKEGNDLVLSDNMDSSDNFHLDVFLEKGNLYFDINNASLEGVDGEGNLTEDTDAIVTSGMVLNGNFIVNGLLGGLNDGGDNIDEFGHKLYIRGKTASLNTIKEPTQGRKDLVEKRLGSEYLNYINLENIFAWRCNELIGEGKYEGTDGVACGKAGDKYSHQSIIFLPRQYESLFY